MDSFTKLSQSSYFRLDSAPLIWFQAEFQNVDLWNSSFKRTVSLHLITPETPAYITSAVKRDFRFLLTVKLCSACWTVCVAAVIAGCCPGWRRWRSSSSQRRSLCCRSSAAWIQTRWVRLPFAARVPMTFILSGFSSNGAKQKVFSKLLPHPPLWTCQSLVPQPSSSYSNWIRIFKIIESNFKEIHHFRGNTFKLLFLENKLLFLSN